MSLLSPQLEAFIKVAAYKTVHAAADALYITQTAVTQRLRALESKLATTLFIRTRRGMMLTPEGEALLRYCFAAQALEGEALAGIKGAATQTEIQLTISGPTSFMHSRVIPQCFKAMRLFPQLLMHFDISDTEERAKSLRAGRCQLAIIQPEHIAAEMQSKILQAEHYVLVCSSQWQHRKLIDIINQEYIIDYNPEDQMTFNYLRHFNLFEQARTSRHFVNRTESLASMLVAGHGYGVLTKEFSKPFVDKGQLLILNDGEIYENTLSLAWYQRPASSNYFTALIEGIS